MQHYCCYESTISCQSLNSNLVHFRGFPHFTIFFPWGFQIGRILTIVCVGVGGKWKKFMFFFMKSKLKNHLNEHLILLWECALELSIVSILSHMTHALMNGRGRSRNLDEHWIRFHNWDLGWILHFTPIIHGPYSQQWHLMAKFFFT